MQTLAGQRSRVERSRRGFPLWFLEASVVLTGVALWHELGKLLGVQVLSGRGCTYPVSEVSVLLGAKVLPYKLAKVPRSSRRSGERRPWGSWNPGRGAPRLWCEATLRQQSKFGDVVVSRASSVDEA